MPAPSMVIGQVVKSYPQHEDARAAVDRLASRKFPVERLSIIGRDAQTVERITGQISIARLVVVGALIGGLLGALLGATLGALVLTIPGLLIGLLIGAIWAPAQRALRRGRDFTTETEHDVGCYTIVADRDDLARQARRTLLEMEGHP